MAGEEKRADTQKRDSGSILNRAGELWQAATQLRGSIEPSDYRRLNPKEERRRAFQITDQFHGDELPTQAGSHAPDLFIQNEQVSRTLSALRDALLPRLLFGEVRLKQAEKAVEATP